MSQGKQLKPLMRVFCAWCKRELPPAVALPAGFDVPKAVNQ